MCVCLHTGKNATSCYDSNVLYCSGNTFPHIFKMIHVAVKSHKKKIGTSLITSVIFMEAMYDFVVLI